MLVFVSATAWAQPAAKPPAKAKPSTLVTVTNHVSSHCGGAALPPDEPLFDDSPAIGATYLVRSGRKNTKTKVIVQAKTDNAGHLWLELPKGTYCLITPDKRDLTAPSVVASPKSPSREEVDKTACDLVLNAPTKKAKIDLYTSTCPRSLDGSQPP